MKEIKASDIKSNFTLALKPGDYFISKTIDMKGIKNFIIKGDQGKANIEFNKNSSIKSQCFRMDKNCENVTFQDLNFRFGSNTINQVKGKNITFRACGVYKNSAGLFDAHGVNGLLCENCYDIDGEFTWNFGFFEVMDSELASSLPRNENITIRNNKMKFGSRDEHCFRFHNSHHVLVEHNELDNYDQKNRKHPLNFRDGNDYVIQNNILRGSVPIGPLRIVGHEKRRLSNVVFRNNQMLADWNWSKGVPNNSFIFIECGASNIVIDNITGNFGGQGSVISIKGTTQGKPLASGRIVNCNVKSKDPFLGGDFKNFDVCNNKIEGKTVPNKGNC